MRCRPFTSEANLAVLSLKTSLMPGITGTDAELKSPVYDCELVKSALETSMGIPTENIILLVDDGETATDETLPTKRNIEVRPLQSFYHMFQSMTSEMNDNLAEARPWQGTEQ